MPGRRIERLAKRRFPGRSAIVVFLTGKAIIMKLGTKGRYAVMALADIAQAGDSRPVVLADIAGRQDISLSYLEQLFSRLRQSGIVESVRGPGGGYRLARPAAEIPLAAVILAVDEPVETTRCAPASRLGCTHKTARCVTHDLWVSLRMHIFAFLEKISLADVVEGRVGDLGTDPDLLAPGMCP